jgi:DNA-binding response OmpR family regulator
MRTAVSSALLCSPSGSYGTGPGASGMSEQEVAHYISGHRILVVEDEALLAFDLELTVSEFGGDVLGPAHSLDEARRIVSDTTDIDAAILDVDLRGEDVFPIAHILQLRGTPFVFHTGHGSRFELMTLFPGAIVCRKPASSAQLLSHIATLIRDASRI